MKLLYSLLVGALLAAPMPALAINPPEASEAFGVFVSTGAGGSVKVHFDVQPGFAVYRDKITLTTEGGQLANVAIPRGRAHNDPYVGQTELLGGFVTVETQVRASTPAQPVLLKVHFLGCMVDEFCYPPQRLEFELGKL